MTGISGIGRAHTHTDTRENGVLIGIFHPLSLSLSIMSVFFQSSPPQRGPSRFSPRRSKKLRCDTTVTSAAVKAGQRLVSLFFPRIRLVPLSLSFSPYFLLFGLLMSRGAYTSSYLVAIRHTKQQQQKEEEKREKCEKEEVENKEKVVTVEDDEKREINLRRAWEQSKERNRHNTLGHEMKVFGDDNGTKKNSKSQKEKCFPRR